MTTHEIMEDVEEADRDREAGPVLQFLAATARLIISVAITLLGLITLTFSSAAFCRSIRLSPCWGQCFSGSL